MGKGDCLREFSKSDHCKAAAPASDPQVLGIQKGLKLAGYDPGKIDGVMGNDTRAAISKLQQTWKVPVTGNMDAQTKVAFAKAIALVQMANSATAQGDALAEKGKADVAKAKAEAAKKEAEKKKQQEARDKDKSWIEKGMDYVSALPKDEQDALTNFGAKGLKDYQEAKARVAAQQSELPEAHRQYKATGKIPKTKQSFFAIEIMEGRLMNPPERMDLMLKAQGKTVPQMGDVGDTDPAYLTHDEFIKETKNRADDFLDQCGRHSSKCQEQVNEQFGGKGFEEYDRRESQRKYHQYQEYEKKAEGIESSGPLSLAGRVQGEAVCYAVTGDAETAEACGDALAAVGAVGDIIVAKTTVPPARQPKNYEHTKAPEVHRDEAAEIRARVAEPPTQPPGEPLANTRSEGSPDSNTNSGSPPPQPPAESATPNPARPRRDTLVGYPRPVPPGPNLVRPITIQTPRGPRTLTLEDYRHDVQRAIDWVTAERVNNPHLDDAELNRRAAGQFNLDENWHSITNENYHR